MRKALLLLLLFSGCQTADPRLSDITTAEIAAELACRFSTIAAFDAPPSPDAPREGCAEGCGCNGTGREKTGDGLDTVPCRCPDDCDCKKNAAEPPLVPVPEAATRRVKESDGRIECRNGTCYWIDNATGQRYRVIK